MTIRFSKTAEATIDQYFDNYVGGAYGNDMVQRAYHYSRIRVAMLHIFALDTYVIENNKFVDIDDICSVEYALENNDTEVLVKNIYFRDNTKSKTPFEFKVIINH